MPDTVDDPQEMIALIDGWIDRLQSLKIDMREGYPDNEINTGGYVVSAEGYANHAVGDLKGAKTRLKRQISDE